MYKTNVAFQNLHGRPANVQIHLMLDERSVFKNLVELQFLMSWRESMEGPIREIPTEDVVEFYNNVETIVLAAYGEPSKDGLSFDRSGTYAFENSLAFNALMMNFLADPKEAQKMVEEIIPKGLEEWAKTADANIAKAASDARDSGNVDQAAEIERLRAELAAKESQATGSQQA